MKTEQHTFETTQTNVDAIIKHIESGVRETDRQVMFLSDFDYTLCRNYGFDVATNNRIPILEQELIDAANYHTLAIATARRANNPMTPLFWNSGLLAPDAPLIAENGGVLVTQHNGQLHYDDIIDADVSDGLKLAAEQLEHAKLDLPTNRQLIVKLGRTMLVARTQTANMHVSKSEQQDLAKQLILALDVPNFVVVDNGGSVTVQHKNINKATGFQFYLKNQGIDQHAVYVVGLGDAPNDQQIFEQAHTSIGFSKIVKALVDFNIDTQLVTATDIFEGVRASLGDRLYVS